MEESKAHLSCNEQQHLISGMEMECLDFAQLVFGLNLDQYFLTVLFSLCFGRAKYFLYYFMFKYVICFFEFDVTGDYS